MQNKYQITLPEKCHKKVKKVKTDFEFIDKEELKQQPNQLAFQSITKGKGFFNECMLCLTEISNCVLMDCGHSSICFNCTMRMAIKNRAANQPIICHLCRNEIRYALKLDIEKLST